MPGFGSRDTGKDWSLTPSVLSRARKPKPKSLPKSLPGEPLKVPPPVEVSEARPDAAGTLKLILSRLDDMKAEDTTTIDLRGKSPLLDYMIVTSGRANRHVGAIAENIAQALKDSGVDGVRVEGLPACDWVLIDSGDVVVHVFRPEMRSFYNLERLWQPEAAQPA